MMEQKWGLQRGAHLSHGSHKYLDKKWVNGRWKYIYTKPQVVSGGWNDGARDNQSWKDITIGNGTKAGVIKGANRRTKYYGVSVGKLKDDYEYKEKSVKVGRTSIAYDNENGTHNLTVYVDHKKEKAKKTASRLSKKQKTKQSVDKGKSWLDKRFSKKK